MHRAGMSTHRAYNAMHKCMGARNACALNIDTYLIEWETHRHASAHRHRPSSTWQCNRPAYATGIPLFQFARVGSVIFCWRCTLVRAPIRSYRYADSTNDTAKILPRSFSWIHRCIDTRWFQILFVPSISSIRLSLIANIDRGIYATSFFVSLWNAVIRLADFYAISNPFLDSNEFETTSRWSKYLLCYRSVLIVILFFLLCNDSL